MTGGSFVNLANHGNILIMGKGEGCLGIWDTDFLGFVIVLDNLALAPKELPVR